MTTSLNFKLDAFGQLWKFEKNLQTGEIFCLAFSGALHHSDLDSRIFVLHPPTAEELVEELCR